MQTQLENIANAEVSDETRTELALEADDLAARYAAAARQLTGDLAQQARDRAEEARRLSREILAS